MAASLHFRRRCRRRGRGFARAHGGVLIWPCSALAAVFNSAAAAAAAVSGGGGGGAGRWRRRRRRRAPRGGRPGTHSRCSRPTSGTPTPCESSPVPRRNPLPQFLQSRVFFRLNSPLVLWCGPSERSRDYDGACLQMRMSYSASSSSSCSLAGALGLIRIPIYKVYVDGATPQPCPPHSRKASQHQVILRSHIPLTPSLMQLEHGISGTDDWRRRAVCSQRYTRIDG